jgi:polyisoprenoid-binding protein YceI
MIGDTRRTVVTVAIALVVVALLLGGGYGLWYLFLRPAEPAAVDATSVPLPSSVASSAALSGGIDGTWKVDTAIGSFSDFSSSYVGYRVQEQLASIGGNIAVGRTPNVSGTLTIAGTKVTDASFEADLTTLASSDQRRDGQLRNQGIQTSQFPMAQFKLISPLDLGSVPTDGQEIDVTASGQLTLHGQTRDVQIPLKAKLSGGTIVVTGSLTIAWSDYGISKPNSFAVVSIADQGTMELQLFFTKS